MQAAPTASNGMLTKLAGSRATLMINVAGLLMACILAVEIGFAEHQTLLFPRQMDILVCFIPAMVTFIARSRPLSIIFLTIYAALTLRAGRDIWMILAGTPIQYPGSGGLGFLETLFAVASVIFMPVFLFAAFVRWLARHPG